jgi:hypothetical protein
VDGMGGVADGGIDLPPVVVVHQGKAAAPWQWTRKAGGKTITRLVPGEQLDDYRQWLDNHRRLRALVAELEALTLAIADAGPRGKRQPASPRHTTQTSA